MESSPAEPNDTKGKRQGREVGLVVRFIAAGKLGREQCRQKTPLFLSQIFVNSPEFLGT